MLQLPIELRRQCVDSLAEGLEGLDSSEEDWDCSNALKALRLVNRDLGSIASEHLFRRVVFDPTDDSIERFIKVMQSNLSPLVLDVVIDVSVAEPRVLYIEEAEVEESFVAAVKAIEQCHNLEGIEIRFSDECEVCDDIDHYVAQSVEYRCEVLELVFNALAHAEKLERLTIKNLQDYHEAETFEKSSFLAVRNRLKQLHLNVATEYDSWRPEYAIKARGLHDGFTHHIPKFWLKPLSQQLTHLSLYCPDLWGIWPFVDLREIPTFPYLKSLCLGNFMFAHDWQVDWIVSHGSSLQNLYFDDCKIVVTLNLNAEQIRANFPGMETPVHRRVPTALVHVDLRWHVLLDRLRRGLPNLRQFVTGVGDWDDDNCFDDRYRLQNSLRGISYQIFDCTVAPSPWLRRGVGSGHKTRFIVGFDGQEYIEVEIEVSIDKEEDKRALMELLGPEQRIEIESETAD